MLTCFDARFRRLAKVALIGLLFTAGFGCGGKPDTTGQPAPGKPTPGKPTPAGGPKSGGEGFDLTVKPDAWVPPPFARPKPALTGAKNVEVAEDKAQPPLTVGEVNELAYLDAAQLVFVTAGSTKKDLRFVVYDAKTRTELPPSPTLKQGEGVYRLTVAPDQSAVFVQTFPSSEPGRLHRFTVATRAWESVPFPWDGNEECLAVSADRILQMCEGDADAKIRLFRWDAGATQVVVTGELTVEGARKVNPTYDAATGTLYVSWMKEGAATGMGGQLDRIGVSGAGLTKLSSTPVPDSVSQRTKAVISPDGLRVYVASAVMEDGKWRATKCKQTIRRAVGDLVIEEFGGIRNPDTGELAGQLPLGLSWVLALASDHASFWAYQTQSKAVSRYTVTAK